MATVEDILLKKGSDVIATGPNTTVSDAIMMMVQADVGSVVIETGPGEFGIFTEHDLLNRAVAGGHDLTAITVSDLMTSPIITCNAADDLQCCAARMAENHVRHLVVVDRDEVVGLISARDILEAKVLS